MHNKKRPINSIDGFIPQSNQPRRIGFGQPETYRRASNFPTVGQTLSSYQPTPTLPDVAPPHHKQPTMTMAPENPIESRKEKKNKTEKAEKKHRRLSWKKRILLVLLIPLLIGGWLGFKFVYNASKVFHGNVFGVLTTTKLQGEDEGRVNILLAGNSADDAGHDGAELTDSIMIISINTKSNQAYLLSVPRDLWVDIPGYGHAKINEAYVDGEDEGFDQSGYFPGGMGLLQEVIQQNFDINLNYYGLVDYNAFRDMVNAVGGISVNIKSDDPRGLYDPSIDYSTKGPLVKLTNGVHTLNGEQALDLARARGDAYGSYGFPAADFDRTQNQRLMLVALKSKVASTSVITNPVKLSSLFDAIGNNVKTNFSLSEVHRLYDLTKNIPSSGIQSVGLNDANGKNLLASYTADNGESALIPAAGLDEFGDIQAYVNQLTSSDPVVHEAANVVVLNGTTTSGLAASASKVLTAKGMSVTDTANAPATQTTSSIVDLSGGSKPNTRAALVKLYGDHVTTTDPYNGLYNADFIVVLGQDQVKPATTSSNQ